MLPLFQAGALVNAYVDGSILIHIGGVEVGQGLYTKMIQIASRVLGISVDHIHIKETNTDITPNVTDTAASSTSDVYGMAVKVSKGSGRIWSRSLYQQDDTNSQSSSWDISGPHSYQRNK